MQSLIIFMDRFIQRLWYSRHPLINLLWPFSFIYSALMQLRSLIYNHIKTNTKFNVPIIVVGNITVGGTGKTPLVITVVNWLKDNGWHPGIVSRGYGGHSKTWPQEVHVNSKADMVGDEPLLLKLKTGVPVMVGPERVAAVKELLNKYVCNIIISDDGLQHLALQRDIEIVVMDGKRRLGNGLCIPVGPLRESAKRLKTVDFIINNGDASTGELTMQLSAGNIYQIKNPQCLLNLNHLNKSIHAVAGIGYPDRFFAILRALGLKFIAHPFPDHYSFQKRDLEFGSDSCVIMTEKDAVKCAAFADERYWCLPIKAEIDPAFFAGFEKKLRHNILRT